MEACAEGFGIDDVDEEAYMDAGLGTPLFLGLLGVEASFGSGMVKSLGGGSPSWVGCLNMGTRFVGVHCRTRKVNLYATGPHNLGLTSR